MSRTEHEQAGTDRSLRSGFLRSADRSPDAIAVEVAGEALTYADLRERAASLAVTLTSNDPRPADDQGECLAEGRLGLVALAVPEAGLGRAINDRLKRGSAR